MAWNPAWTASDKRVVIRDDAAPHAVAAGVRQLHGNQQVIRGAELLAMRAAHGFEQARERGDILSCDPELAGVGAAIFADGGGFEPYELRAAARKTFVAADGQLVGTAVGRSVTAFHGVDRDGVAHLEPGHAHRAGEGGANPRGVVFELHVRGAKLSGAVAQIIQRFVSEVPHLGGTVLSVCLVLKT